MPRTNRKRKALDWIVNPGCWMNSTSFATQMFATVPPADVSEVCALTLPAALNMQAGDLRAAYFQDDVTAVRVKGMVHWRWRVPDTPFATDAWYKLTLRVVKASADPETGSWPNPGFGYSLDEAGTADESFLWHHEIELSYSRPGFWTSYEQLTRLVHHGTIPVDIGVSRRLEPHEGLYLLGQFTDMSANFVHLNTDLFVVPRLRTLLRET